MNTLIIFSILGIIIGLVISFKFSDSENVIGIVIISTVFKAFIGGCFSALVGTCFLGVISQLIPDNYFLFERKAYIQYI